MIVYDHDIKSTNIQAVSWQKGIGYIQFMGGRRFAYTMSKQLFDDMKSASSVGSYFARNIKGKCPVVWNGHACDNSPCQADAVMIGEVGGGKFHVCSACADHPRFEKVVFSPIPESGR